MADETATNVVRLLELMDIAPGSYDEETALDAIALIEAQQAEIERLRAAGDALHAAVRNHDLTEAHLRAWQEACRG